MAVGRSNTFVQFLHGVRNGELEIALRFHPIMKDPDDRNSVRRDSKIDHVPLYTAAPVARTDSVAGRRFFRVLGQLRKC
ncbi:hypothetical protein D3C84_1106950 [compost metagenome]